ncbi:hypothetical protein LOZ80_12165 [Paenibacillus sp. HWE-109]|uniref:hypothetical protein n=1 Tax=Paenibacillus sp. HWE-109 TaxID=1306526 RepID=UPI001EE02289|nr:hypothetical protein [Paenibacillus sp. HWE-109]UKS29639.1 hypothetical protein LOZ80_12165 [Paenibacillus sp. HWE-109]
MQYRMRKAVKLGLAGGVSWAVVSYFLNKNIGASIVGASSWFIVTILIAWALPESNQK